MDWHEVFKIAQAIFATGAIIYVLYGLYRLPYEEKKKK